MRDGSKTRAKIESEALRLFAEKGVVGTSVRDIAAAVGVAEAALYRHFPSKDALSRSLFLQGYARLAADVVAVGETHHPIEAKIGQIVDLFCRLFDDDRSLFSFLLLAQHAHLADVPEGRESNVVEAVKNIFVEAITHGDIREEDPDLLAALALGIVAQPAIFTIYGRLLGPLAARAPDLTRAIWAAVR
ncbi:TetR/AcrR family transcriptional regulator [Labrys okinawensis]|uniref:TetR/AcrR family transcriptional regulator n=1 Tax=Labrys okinawensis TaxID=346911 RepID=UPI0039BC29FD